MCVRLIATIWETCLAQFIDIDMHCRTVQCLIKHARSTRRQREHVSKHGFQSHVLGLSRLSHKPRHGPAEDLQAQTAALIGLSVVGRLGVWLPSCWQVLALHWRCSCPGAARCHGGACAALAEMPPAAAGCWGAAGCRLSGALPAAAGSVTGDRSHLAAKELPADAGYVGGTRW